MNQLELPGDVWNNSPYIREKLFPNIFNVNSLPKTWGMPKIITELYNQLKDEEIY